MKKETRFFLNILGIFLFVSANISVNHGQTLPGNTGQQVNQSLPGGKKEVRKMINSESLPWMEKISEESVEVEDWMLDPCQYGDFCYNQKIRALFSPAMDPGIALEQWMLRPDILYRDTRIHYAGQEEVGRKKCRAL